MQYIPCDRVVVASTTPAISKSHLVYVLKTCAVQCVEFYTEEGKNFLSIFFPFYQVK